MNERASKTNRKGIPVFASVVSLLLTLVFIRMVSDGLEKLICYEESVGRAVTVSGVITEIQRDTDSEGDEYFDLYVTFSAEGKTFTEWYDRMYSDSAMDRKGETVSFRIDPENPGELIDNSREDGQISYLFGTFAGWCFCAPLLLALIRRFDGLNGKTNVEVHGLTEENIQKDLIRYSTWKMGMIFCLPCALWGTLSWWMLPNALAGTMWFMIYLWGLGVWCLCGFLAECRKIRQGEYRVRSGRVNGRDYDTDSDGPDTYYLYCVCGDECWKWIVSTREYEQIPDGTRVTTVFFGKKNKPRITYQMDRCQY